MPTPLTRHQQKRRRRNRLTLLVVALVVLIGGVVGLYYVQSARQQQARLDPAARDAAVRQIRAGDYEAGLLALKPYNESGQTTADSLDAWAEARQAVPLPDGAHIAESVGALRRALAKEPGHAAAADRLLQTLSRYPQGVENELVAVADRVLEDRPDDETALRARALGLASHKRYAEAARATDRYLQVRPDDLQMQRLTLDMMKGEKQPPSALTTRAEALAAADPDSVNAELVRAHAKLLDNDRAGARPHLAAAVTREPTDPKQVLQLVQMLDAAGAHTAVLPYLEKAFAAGETFADDAGLAGELTLRRFEAGRLEDTLALLEDDSTGGSLYLQCVRAIAEHGRGRFDAMNVTLDAIARRDTNRYRAAADLLRAALPADAEPDPAAVIAAARAASEHDVKVAYVDALVADANLRVGELGAAEAAYRSALSQRPAWAGPCLGLAGLFLRQDDAAQAYRYAVAAGEREGRTLRVAIVTARAAGARLDDLNDAQLEELSGLIAQVQRVSPGEPNTAVLNVEVLARRGERDAAAAAAREALRSEPPLNEQATLRLGSVARRFDLGLTDELDRTYVDRFGRTPRIAMTRAADAARDGDPDAAVAAFDAAMPAEPDAEWAVNRALLYERLDRPDALDRWREAAAAAPDDARVQSRVLASGVAWSDRALVESAITRLRAAEPGGDTWRRERARYLLTSDDPAARAAEALRLLEPVTDAGSTVELMRATAQRLTGDALAAAGTLQNAAARDPDDAALKLELARAEAAAGRPDRARDAVRPLTLGQDTPAPILREAADILLRVNAVDDASRALTRLQDSGEGTDDDVWRLAQLRRRAGEPSEAAALITPLLDDADAGRLAFAAGVYAEAGQTDAEARVLERLDALDLPETQKLTLRAAHDAARGRLEAADAAFAAAAESDPQNPGVWRNLAEFRLRAGRRDGALDAAARATDAGINDPGLNALAERADRLRGMPDGPTLVPLLSRLLTGTDADRAVIDRAVALLADDASADAFVQLADSRPDLAPLEVLTVDRLRAAGRPADAQARAEQAFARHPDDVRLAQSVAEGHALRNDWTQTLLATDRWRALSPAGSLTADTLAAQAHRRLGRPDRALDMLAAYRDRIVDRPDETPILTRQYAILLASAGREAEARSLLEPLLTEDPYWRMTWLDVATQGVRDVRDAGGWLQRVEDLLDETRLEERSAIAQAWWGLGRRDDHPPYLERARTRLTSLAEDPDANAEVWFFLGTIAEHDGDPAAAAAHYRRALELDPEAHNAANNLSLVLVRTPNAGPAQIEEAVALADGLVRRYPDRPNELDTRAAVLLAAGRPDEARQSIERAIEIDPGNPAWRVRLDQINAAAAGDATP